jgi:hypothetical protein
MEDWRKPGVITYYDRTTGRVWREDEDRDED